MSKLPKLWEYPGRMNDEAIECLEQMLHEGPIGEAPEPGHECATLDGIKCAGCQDWETQQAGVALAMAQVYAMRNALDRLIEGEFKPPSHEGTYRCRAYTYGLLDEDAPMNEAKIGITGTTYVDCIWRGNTWYYASDGGKVRVIPGSVLRHWRIPGYEYVAVAGSDDCS